MSDESTIQVVIYEAWMKNQIIQLFSDQYGVSVDAFSTTFDQFYEHPFQQEKTIRLVAVEDKTVVGFQSFFYWPCTFKGKTYQVFQSGNSLVHPGYRGRGIFGKLLAYIHQNQTNLEYDFLIGFPVEMSFGSFIRKKWLNPFDLTWYYQTINPVRSVLGSATAKMQKAFPDGPDLDFEPGAERLSVQMDSHFREYRKAYAEGEYYYFNYQDGENKALFDLKLQTRKSVIKEVIIGKVTASSYAAPFLQKAFDAMISQLKRSGAATMLSFACNEKDGLWQELMPALKMKKLDRIIHFICLGDKVAEVNQFDQWAMYRADIDTW